MRLRLEARYPNSQALPAPLSLLFKLLPPLFSLGHQDKTCCSPIVLVICFYQCIRKQGTELWNIFPLHWRCCWGLLYLHTGGTLSASCSNNSEPSRAAARPKPALCFCNICLEFSSLMFWQQAGENFEWTDRLAKWIWREEAKLPKVLR